jgi:hypothetical protein
MNKEKFIKNVFSNHFAPYALLIENGYNQKDVFGLFGGNLLTIVESVAEEMTEKEMLSFWELNC